jgi:hypothetical protein
MTIFTYLNAFFFIYNSHLQKIRTIEVSKSQNQHTKCLNIYKKDRQKNFEISSFLCILLQKQYRFSRVTKGTLQRNDEWSPSCEVVSLLNLIRSLKPPMTRPYKSALDQKLTTQFFGLHTPHGEVLTRDLSSTNRRAQLAWPYTCLLVHDTFAGRRVRNFCNM